MHSPFFPEGVTNIFEGKKMSEGGLADKPPDMSMKKLCASRGGKLLEAYQDCFPDMLHTIKDKCEQNLFGF